MKLTPIFCLFLVSLCLFSLHAQAQGGGKLCPKEMALGGTCADIRGATDCAEKFLAEYGASAMPQHCTCADLQPHESLCKCDIICY